VQKNNHYLTCITTFYVSLIKDIFWRKSQKSKDPKQNGKRGKRRMQPKGEEEGKGKGTLLGEGEVAVQMGKGKKSMQPEGEGEGKGKGKILGEGEAHKMSQRARTTLRVNEKLAEIGKGANSEFNQAHYRLNQFS
jgi:hypothetical protein